MSNFAESERSQANMKPIKSVQLKIEALIWNVRHECGAQAGTFCIGQQ